MINRRGLLVAVTAFVAVFLFVSYAKADVCEASHYGVGDRYGWRRTASGQIMNPHLMTAAHKTLPFGTRVRVTNLANRQSVVVRINDRGPFIRGRCIDLSYAAAKSIGIGGVARVSVTIE